MIDSPLGRISFTSHQTCAPHGHTNCRRCALPDKLIITVYDRRGLFVTKIENPDDCTFFAICIQESLKQISAQMQRRAKFKSAEVDHSVQIEGSDASSILGGAGETDAGRRARLGWRDAEPEQSAGTRQEDEAEGQTEEGRVLVVPV